MRRPLAIDLFCGLGGWAEGLLAEGWGVVGFDIEAHRYGEHRYPAQLVVQDVLTLHGSQFRDAALIVASPPCQFFSYTAMPWSRAKALAAEVRADPARLDAELALFRACFRIQREACEAAGRHVPMVVENVRGAIPWVGRSRQNYGSFHLWGDVPALMPALMPAVVHRNNGATRFERASETEARGTKIGGGAKVEGIGWIGFADSGASWRNREHKIPGFCFDGSGRSFQSAAVAEGYKPAGMNWSDRSLRGQDFTRIAGAQSGVKAPSGIKCGGDWFNSEQPSITRLASSKSSARKMASAMIAKIPPAFSRHIARVYHPDLWTKPRRSA